MSKSIVTGIDIGHHSIKAVTVKPSGQRYTLMDHKEFLLSQPVFTDNHMLDYPSAVSHLNELKKSLPRFQRDVAISIPDTAVISKVLQIDARLEESEKEFAIKQAFSHQSPIPTEELSIDFVEVLDGTLEQSATSTYQVYATRREIVDSRVLAAKKAGLNPVLVDLQAHSQLQVWQMARKKFDISSNWLLVDIGKTQTLLCSGFGGDKPFHKDITFGVGQVEGSKNSPGVEKFCAELTQRLIRQIQMYTSMHPDHAVRGIWLTGGGSLTQGVSVFLADKLRIKCEVLNPLKLLKLRPMAKKPPAEASLFCSAAGLAVRGAKWLGGDNATQD